MSEPKQKKAFTGFFIIGVASFIGGILIFAMIVVPQLKPETGVPRDVQMVFTELFSRQSLIWKERGKYTPALIEVGVEQDQCSRYNCLLTLDPSGDDYLFRMSKDGQTWEIHSKSPVPKEVL